MTAIAINARFYAHRTTGMQRYAQEISRRFTARIESVRPKSALSGPAGHLWEQFYLPTALHGRLLWSPNNTGPLAVTNQVCTIHDLAPLDKPEWFSSQFAAWYRWLLPPLARRVRHIVTISEFSKQRIMTLLGVRPEKITVVANGVDDRFQPASSREIAAMRSALDLGNDPYLLSLGSVEPRKNLGRLLEAWRSAQRSLPSNVSLVVAGARGNSRVFGEVAIDEMPERVHFTGYVADEHLPALYSGASAMLYPSLYEGFGLPPLEALACGTTVVTSQTTAIPEAVGDCAILIDPTDTDSIADGIIRAVTDRDTAADLACRGIEHAERYTWDRSADATLRVLLDASRN